MPHAVRLCSIRARRGLAQISRADLTALCRPVGASYHERSSRCGASNWSPTCRPSLRLVRRSLSERPRLPAGNLRAGFEADLTINRKDFGLSWNAALETGGFLVGDEVRISLSIQAVAQL